MKNFSYVLALFLALLAPSTYAQAPERDLVREGELVEELRQKAPDSVPDFIAATEAMDSGDLPGAEKLYSRVLESVPDFDPALRRKGYIMIELGDRAGGLKLLQEALDLNRSVDNLGGKASALLLDGGDPNFRPTQSELMESNRLAKEAWELSAASDEYSGSIYLDTLLSLDQLSEFDKFAPEFKRRFPDSRSAMYYNAIFLGNRGSFDDAEAELTRLKEMGVPDEAVAPLMGAIIQARDEAYFGLGRYLGYLYVLLGIFAVWAVGLLSLFVVGRWLSTTTLKEIETSDVNDITGSAHESRRKLYRRIVALAGLFYYVSQPIVIMMVIVATVAVIVFFLWVGRIPVVFVIGLGFVGIASIFYMVKSWLIRPKLEDPGRALSESEAPKLWELVRNVAETIKTRPVNEIRITPGTDVAVYERGSFRAKLSDNAERILILGAATINDFDQNAFRAVLAHEYGHFSNRDTAGGEIARRVSIDISRVATDMVNSGTNTYHNLGFHFLRLFDFLFRRITHGATRLQEVLADRVAAHYFGRDSFKDGLTHVIRRELEFNAIANGEIDRTVSAYRASSALYDTSINEGPDRERIESELVQYLNRATTEDDTHPSPADRFRYIQNITMAETEPMHGKVWDLFENRDIIVTEMAEHIKANVVGQESNGSILGI